MAALLPPVFGRLKTGQITEPIPGGETVRVRICSLRWTLAGLVAVAFVSLFYGLGSFRSFGTHETIAVVPAREMLQSGDWVFPKFGGLPRLRKPPLVYWLIATSAKVFGELSPLTARLPSGLAGLLLAGLMGLWARRWYGPGVGWSAVFVQLTSVWFVIFARKAEIDMVLCLFTTTALFLAADQPDVENSARRFWRWLAFYLLLSLSWLAKFHYGPAMILAPVGVYFIAQRRWGNFRGMLHPLGLAVFAAAVVIWPMLVLKQAPAAWEIWRRETVGRALGEMGGHPAIYYLPFLAWLPLPWTFFALASVRESWRSAWRNQDPKERFLGIWFFSQLAILMLSASKHKHYLLALLPVLTLLAARSLWRFLEGFQTGRLRLTPRWTGCLMALNLAACLVAMIVLGTRTPELAAVYRILAATLCFCHTLGWIALYRRNVFTVVSLNLASYLVVGVIVTGWISPHSDRRVNVQEFSAEIREELLPSEAVCVYRMKREPLVYHLGTSTYRAESPKDLQPKLGKNSPLYVVGYERFVSELDAIGEPVPLARLPKGPRNMEPIEGDLVLVKLLPRRMVAKPIIPATANAN